MLKRIELKEKLRLAKIQKHRILQLKYWRKNPLDWLEDRLGEDRKNFAWNLWGDEYKTHTWDGDKNPLEQAWLELAKGKWVGVESATGTGKTHALARIALWFLDTNPGCLVVTSAPKKDQLSLNLWKEIRHIFPKFKKHRNFAELLSLRLKADARKTSEDEVEEDNTDWHIIGFVAGVGANEESATKAQGFHRPRMLIITEETPGMNRAVMTAFENTCTDPENNLILAVGNPDNKTDVLHTFCKKNRVRQFRISALDHPNVVLNRNVIPGAVTRQSIEDRKIDYGINSNLYKSRVHGISPDQAKDSLIRLEWLENAYQCSAKLDNSFNAVGIDVANSENGDKASLAWGNANTLNSIQTFNSNASYIAYNIIYSNANLEKNKFENYHTHKIQDYQIDVRCIGIDAVGVGASTLQTLQNISIDAVALQGSQNIEASLKDDRGQPLLRFNSLRAQMYWELREDLKNGRVNIDVEDNIILANLEEELLMPKFEQKGGKIGITPKPEIVKKLGRSPDIADSVVYWNWVRKGYYMDSVPYVDYAI